MRLPGFTRADGALRYAFADDRTRLALNVENLFDMKCLPTVAGMFQTDQPGAPLLSMQMRRCRAARSGPRSCLRGLPGLIYIKLLSICS